MFLDFGIMSTLLVFAHLLRSRVKLLQNLFIPTAIIAGFLGLLGGPQVLDFLPFSEKPPEPPTAASAAEGAAASESGEPDKAAEAEVRISDYPFYLVVLLFATLLMGHRKEKVSLKAVARNVGDTFSYNLASEIGMFGLALLFGAVALGLLFPALDSDSSSVGGFALLLPAGFVGGHGTANVVGTVLEQNGGFKEALTIGYTFATVGLLAGIVGGMILINIATRSRWTRMVTSAEELPESIRQGFLAEDERQSIGKQTVSPIALDPLTWHVALAFVAFAAAFLADYVIKGLLPGKYSLPLFAFSMLAGAGIQKGLGAFGLGEFVDRRVMGRIGSSVSDYLIAFGVASIKIGVVVKYWQPLLVMSLFGIAYAALLFWYIGRRIFRNFWFERSIFVYGWNTGVVAIGITLLRVVDPKLGTRTLEDFGLAYVFIAFAEIGMLVALPPLVASGYVLVPAVVLVACFLATILLSRSLVGWFTRPADKLREGEDELIKQFGAAAESAA